MHLYSKARRFWGGAGIVGAQIPIAGGLAFVEKYKAKGVAPMNVDSGEHRGKRRIRGGRMEPRNVLYMAATAICFKKDSFFKEIYDALIARGKDHKRTFPTPHVS